MRVSFDEAAAARVLSLQDRGRFDPMRPLNPLISALSDGDLGLETGGWDRAGNPGPEARIDRPMRGSPADTLEGDQLCAADTTAAAAQLHTTHVQRPCRTQTANSYTPQLLL